MTVETIRSIDLPAETKKAYKQFLLSKNNGLGAGWSGLFDAYEFCRSYPEHALVVAGIDNRTFRLLKLSRSLSSIFKKIKSSLKLH